MNHIFCKTPVEYKTYREDSGHGDEITIGAWHCSSCKRDVTVRECEHEGKPI